MGKQSQINSCATSKTSGSRIARNTALLYIRMLVLMGVNLIATRIVLSALGEDDYGLYTLVGGIAVFLSFINTSMAAASMRFQSYEKGLPDDERDEQSVFSSILIVQAVLSIIILILGETGGVWYLNNCLNAPATSLPSAHIVFQFALFQFIAKTLSSPYTASILANERMDIFAWLSLLEGFLQLGIAFMITALSSNTLIMYAALMFTSVAVTQSAYVVITRKKFTECHFCNRWRWSDIRNILSYSGWNLLGAFSSVCIGVGVNMVLNYFFGLAINAARGLALQVNAAVSSLATNFQQALNPQIVKTYAANDEQRLNSLIINGTRLCFYMMALLAIPIIVYMDSLLSIWLTEVPAYTSGFCRLVLLSSLFTPLSGCLMATAMASTDIRRYQLVVAGINLMNIPLTVVLLRIWPNPYIAMYVMLALAAAAMVARMFLTRSVIRFNVRAYMLKSVISPILIVSAFSLPAWYIGTVIAPESFVSTSLCLLATLTAEVIYLYFLGMTSVERMMIKGIIVKRLHLNKQ